MGSNLERFRRLKEQSAIASPADVPIEGVRASTATPNRKPPQGGSGTAPPKSEKKPFVKPPPQIIGHTPGVVRSCNHTEDFPEYAGQKPEHREGRLKKFQSKKCTACKAADQAKEMQEAAERRKNKPPKKRWEKRDTSPATRDGWMAAKGRLPHGSAFVVRYDDVAQSWGGSIIEAMSPECWQEIREVMLKHKAKEISDTGSGVFRLLTNLDAQYRESLLPK